MLKILLLIISILIIPQFTHKAMAKISVLDPGLNTKVIYRYLTQNAAFFQGLNLEVSIENEQKKLDSEIVIMNSLLPRTPDFNARYQLAAIGAVNSATTFRKVLVSQKFDLSRIHEIQTLAASGTAELLHLILKMLSEKNPGKLHTSELEIITVSKELDALTSVSFGLFDAAVVSDNSLFALSAISPDVYANLKIIQKSTLINNLEMYIKKGNSAALAELDRFVSNSKEPKMKTALNLLGIENWKRLND